jgi:DNA-binding response OmpR family regulator
METTPDILVREVRGRVPQSRETPSADSGQLRSPAKVLVAVAQPLIAEIVRLALNHGQFLTNSARTGAEAEVALLEWRPHLAVIDMDLGDGELLDRLWVAATMAERIPVIALTRRGDLQSKLTAFERGVDDLLTVPFSSEELVARTLAVMRRTYRTAIPFAPVIRLGDLDIDILHRRVKAGDSELRLTSLELNLLYLLAANSGRLVTREEILDCLWGVDYVTESNIVDRHVGNLRAKLHEDWRRPRFIATVPGRGYRFIGALADIDVEKVDR